jgi:NDP-sugar pyrophosphorylase family protein
MNYRKLDESEIQQLIQQDCQADDWKSIDVTSEFLPDNIHQVSFSGQIKLGRFDSMIEIDPGVYRPTGLRNVFIKDCIIKDNVYIADVRRLINYRIEDNVVIQNVDCLIVSGDTTFSNGLEVVVLNESGGREVPIFDQLTSQIAYLLATVRHDLDFIGNLKNFIQVYSLSKKSKSGLINKQSIISDCGPIRNVTIGSHARISGASELTEGTIVSNKNAPTIIGSGITANSFIVLSGSKITNGALLEKTFVGQGVQVGRQFSAENTLIFANSECFHSEACSIFAGPYTVTHHKSTLLIAAMFSFYNAGSGSNQSNHMYKLGPVHQGILERGAKTGSFSYMVWPSRVGAFSVVIGKHYSNFDNTDLPFSYILESEGKTITIPALNFFTVGTKRDSIKWPKRDRRQDPEKHDILNFDLLSPYIIGKALKAEQILQSIRNDSNGDDGLVPYKGQYIEGRRIQNSLMDYQKIIDIYIGEQVIKRVSTIKDPGSFEAYKSSLISDTLALSTNWIDMSGLVCPQTEIQLLSERTKSGDIGSVEQLRGDLRDIHTNYDHLSWSWCISLILERYEVDWEDLTAQTFIDIISSWEAKSIEVNQRIMEDAEKEFAPKSRIGYGIDSNQKTVDNDFKNVRGSFDTNNFVIDLREENETIKEIAEKLISSLTSLKG